MTLSLEVALVKRLNDSAAITALLTGRILPWGASEQTTKPYAVYSIISHNNETRMAGGSELSYYRAQLDIFAATFDSLLAVRDAIRNRLHGYRGTITFNADTRYFHSIFMESERDESINPTDGSDAFIYKRSLDFILSTTEPLPALNA